MRKWARSPEILLNRGMRVWMIYVDGRGIGEADTEELAQFIVDACNAAEAWSERNTGLSVEPPFSREAVTNVTMHPAPLGGLAVGNKTGGKRTLFRRTKPL